MKRDGDIASLFQKHKAKKLAASSSPAPVPAATVVEEPIQVQERIIEEDVNPSLVASSVLSESIEAEDVLPPIPPPIENVLPPQSPIYDVNCLPYDPGERLPLQVILLMIKMQLEGHIFSKVHSNLMDMNLRKG